MSRTSRGVGRTLAVSIRETLELEQSSLAATSSIVRPAASRSFRSSVANRRRPTVWVRLSMPRSTPSWRVVHPLAREALRNLPFARRAALDRVFRSFKPVTSSSPLVIDRIVQFYVADREKRRTSRREKTPRTAMYQTHSTKSNLQKGLRRLHQPASSLPLGASLSSAPGGGIATSAPLCGSMPIVYVDAARVSTTGVTAALAGKPR